MKEEKEKTHFNIDHSDPVFFADGFTISHTPNKFILDFTQRVPKFDIIEGKINRVLNVNHKTILMDPFVAKDLIDKMKENLNTYEKTHAKIKLPKNAKEKKEKDVIQTNVKGQEIKYIG